MTGVEDVSIPLPRSGITLRGYRRATRRGIPTLCLHGWLDNCASFTPLFDLLPDADLVAVDLPGHGWSDPSPSATCQYLEYVACVLELVRELGWERFQLIGHSLGGALSSLLAGIHPDRVSRLVLLDAIGPLPASPQESLDGVAGYLGAYLDGARHPVYRTRAGAVLARVQLADILLDTAETLVARDLREVPGGYSWRHDVRLKRSLIPTFTEDQVLAFLRNITAPTLLIKAERSALQESFYPQRVATVPDLRQVMLPGGHHLHLENAGAVSIAVRAFLDTA